MSDDTVVDLQPFRLAPLQDILGTPGDDLLIGTIGRDEIRGRGGDETMFELAGADSFFGNAGNDTLEGGAGSHRIAGGGGGDTLSGDAGRDRLLGGGGRDLLDGGADPDILTGGAGTDRFVITSLDGDADRITDYDPSAEVIDLSNLLPAEASLFLDDFVRLTLPVALSPQSIEMVSVRTLFQQC